MKSYLLLNMPTLNWIGKEAVVNHDKEVPFRLLKKVKAHSVGDSQNLIIHGDNLEALKALMPYYTGKIKCIYIDPPYNTGNESWVYNDRVNSPKIKRWLGKIVGGESQDLCRHDKWLCMMYPRIKLLKDLLTENGVIFVSIDDNEQSNLKHLLDEIFGEQNFMAQIVWKKKAGGGNAARFFADDHEYILCYANDKTKLDAFFVKLDDKDKQKYKLKDEYFEERGAFLIKNLTQEGSLDDRPNLRYEILNPEGKPFLKDNGEYPQWRVEKKQFERLLNEGRIYMKKVKKKDGSYYYTINTKQYLYDAVDDEGEPIFRRKKPRTIFDFAITGQGRKALAQLFDTSSHQDSVFTYPKPVELISHIIDIVTSNDDIILDSFAGSGTTGHAVLDLNKEDKSKRRFILIELEEHAKNVTAERVKRAIEKYDYKDGFEYCELDKPLFDENGQIEETCDFNQFATYIYFTETQTNIDKKQIDKNFIGESGETEYYLIYKEKYKNVLNKSFLSKIKKNKNKKVIYADRCLIDEDILEKYNIIFKQIPYEVKVY